MTEPGYELDRDEEGLTKRERQVLEGLKAGKTKYRIAQEIGVSRQRVTQLTKALEEKGALNG